MTSIFLLDKHGCKWNLVLIQIDFLRYCNVYALTVVIQSVTDMLQKTSNFLF
jgi:hypothetical protein